MGWEESGIYRLSLTWAQKVEGFQSKALLGLGRNWNFHFGFKQGLISTRNVYARNSQNFFEKQGGEDNKKIGGITGLKINLCRFYKSHI